MKHAAEFTEHLKQAGRFTAFKKRRKQMEDEGKPKHVAWTTAAAEFGWSENWAPPDEQPEFDDIAEFDEPDLIPVLLAECETPDLKTAFRWAYHNLHLSERQLSDPKIEAPSAFARQLASYAKSGATAMKHFIDRSEKYLADQQTENEQRLQDDRRNQMALIDGFCAKEMELAAQAGQPCPYCGGDLPNRKPTVSARRG